MSTTHLKKQVKNSFVVFQNTKEIYLPNLCLICGKETENRIEKTKIGTYTYGKDYKKDYHFKLPICDDCNFNIKLKSGISSKRGIFLILGPIIGVSLAILLYFLTYAIILSIAVVVISILLPLVMYRAYIKPKIKLPKFFQIDINSKEDLVQFQFLNENYADFVKKINFEKNREKEETETMEKTPPLDTDETDVERTLKGDFNNEPSPKDSIKSPININGEIMDGYLEKIMQESPTITKKCPKCGSAIKPEWKFCIFCSEMIKE
ncbi:MAG: hypothetical protein ACFFBI_03735 [Promethearchaeota archaeon]